MRQRRALRQFTLSTGKSAGRNSSGRITVFHRGGGSKRLQRRIDLKRSTSSIGIVERIEYEPNRSSRIAPVRWTGGGVRQRKCKTIEEFAPPRKILESTTTTICGPFSFSSLPGKGDQRKVACFSPGRMATYVVVGLPTRMPSWSKSPFFTSKDAGSKKTCAKDVFFSALSSPKAKGETASLSFGSSFGFPRIAVAGAKPAFFAPRMREKVRGKNTFSLCEIRKWRTHSILWVHRIKRKAALSWQSFRRQETLGLVGASERNESKPKTDQGSLPAKPIGEGLKDGTCKVDRAPVTYIIASHQLEAGKMVMNCDWSKPSTSDLLRPAQNAHTD
ncbi:ribosomal protein L2 (mitochondrion) [Nicotiana tabacum]|uniref:60S ribosomal protein L2, mitochondrial n=3 Tax=Solanaceae TaxID=4070 RepID=A0A1S4EUK8_TOBAC|nr:ribosomal protein L2 [Nicotiana sylvestris]YP_173485.1 ribosomal protein L2 [Nicotiana tabacum]AJM70209.1 ribosomal protein L2 [Nicotiana tabacum/Hyoscyamus niger cybrid]AMR36230.1 ribosomal protein L2 [Nicotiana sylvestris]QEP94814.1 ribosomal protein L2 [Nicotiana tabacum/Hyoscyamus niger cybrid]UYX57543.1 ribosomal protein L2 [Nicotiana tabacum]